MRSIRLAAAVALCAGLAPAETWELGGIASFNFLKSTTIQRDSASAKAGLEHMAGASFYAGHREKRMLAGEFHYGFRPGALKLTGSGADVKFASSSHLVHYDLQLLPMRGNVKKWEPYFNFGGGLRYISGSGRQTAFQGYNNLAVLSRTSEILPLLSVAAGMRTKLSKHTFFRVEFRDNITPFPGKVIFVNRQASSGGWWHDFSPAVGFGVTF